MAELTVERNRLSTSDTPTDPVSPSTGQAGSSVLSAGATSQVLAPANPDRVALIICNDHATQVIYLGLGTTAVVNQGIRVNAAGGSHRIDYFTGAVHAVASGATTPAIFVEI